MSACLLVHKYRAKCPQCGKRYDHFSRVKKPEVLCDDCKRDRTILVNLRNRRAKGVLSRKEARRLREEKKI
jgi:NMD protein affecting ribosome stability and mRNA decay